jgi:prephenate dehydrogenase
MTSPVNRRALVVGIGLIGGSIALGLKDAGWHVSGIDQDSARIDDALRRGIIDSGTDDPDASVAIIATPAGAVKEVAERLLNDNRRPHLIVSDVSGVKVPIVEGIDHPRFIGGHPMAGSERLGLDGADVALFRGAVWVLTPVPGTDLVAFDNLQALVGELGAEVIALPPDEHDRLVAVVSHVPHLVAATLMNAAQTQNEHDAVLLRLAAGGFRDMTRVSAGHPGIWPDVCTENKDAIVTCLDRLLADLQAMRQRVADGDKEGLFKVLERASIARQALPARGVRPANLGEVRVPVLDREGVLAEITAIAAANAINIYDIEIAHSAEGSQGVLRLVVEADATERLAQAVATHGYHPSVGSLS